MVVSENNFFNFANAQTQDNSLAEKPGFASLLTLISTELYFSSTTFFYSNRNTAFCSNVQLKRYALHAQWSTAPLTEGSQFPALAYVSRKPPAVKGPSWQETDHISSIVKF